MAITTFIPEIWSARLLEKLSNELVYGNLVNRDYEGEISQAGDTVHINSFGAITIKKYTKNGEIEAPEELTTDEQTLKIDQSQYFNFGLDDVDKAQAMGGLMEAALDRASYGLSSVADKYIASQMAKEGTAINEDTSPITLTAANIYQAMVEIKVAMDKLNIPQQGRYVVVPPEVEGLLLLEDRFVATGGSAAEGILANGYIGKVAGLDVYTSNNVPNTTGTKYKIVATNRSTTTYAEQVLHTEAYRVEKGFKDAIKGLHVYGAKVTRPKEVLVLTVNFEETSILKPTGVGARKAKKEA